MEFRKISLCDKQAIDALVQKYPSHGCEKCFSTIFLWTQNYGTKIAPWRGRLVIYKEHARLLQYPLGEDTPPYELRELADEFTSHSIPFDYVYDVPPYYPQKFPEFRNYFEILKNDAEADYIYDNSALFNLTGSLLRKKRNHIRHFTDQNPDWTREKVETSNFADFAQFLRTNAADIEKLPVQTALTNFFEMGLDGTILRDDFYNIVGVAAWGKISPEICSIHFEKSDKSSAGAAQMLVKIEAQTLLENGFRLMNREQDMGEPNLRRAKKSLDPLEMYARIDLAPLR